MKEILEFIINKKMKTSEIKQSKNTIQGYICKG